MRVLVSGDRNWARDPLFEFRYEMDAGSPDFHVLCNLLDGYYVDYEIGYEVCHLDPFVLIEGNADGADSCASWWADNSPTHAHTLEDSPPFEHLKFPAEWKKYGRSAGPIRNQQMLDQGQPDIVLAFHHNISESKGTKHMVYIARKAGVPTYVIS